MIPRLSTYEWAVLSDALPKKSEVDALNGAPLKDVSPEDRLDYIPEPFRYSLRPGQGIVLVTSRS